MRVADSGGMLMACLFVSSQGGLLWESGLASLDGTGVIKVWSFNPIMQTTCPLSPQVTTALFRMGHQADRLVSGLAHG